MPAVDIIEFNLNIVPVFEQSNIIKKIQIFDLVKITTIEKNLVVNTEMLYPNVER